MVLKIVVLALLIVILYCLGSAVVYLVRGGSSPVNMARALTWRIALSLILFLLLLVSFLFGWLQPHALMPAAPLPPASSIKGVVQWV